MALACRLFLIATGIVFMIAGGLKIASFTLLPGTSPLSKLIDPFTQLPLTKLYFIAGLAEVAAGLYCLVARNVILRLIAALGLALCIAWYRFANWLIGYDAPCSCFGYFTGAVGMSKDIAEPLEKSVLVIVIVGGVSLIAMRHIANRREARQMSSV